MSHINEKLGLRPARQRSMMKLPKKLADRNRVTSAQCPACGQRGAFLSRVQGREGWFVCSWCHETWEPPAA